MHSFGAKEWADKCEQLDATIADLQSQLVAAKAERDEQGQLKARLNRELNLLQNEHIKLHDKVKQESAHTKQVEIERDALQQQVAQLREERDEFERRLKVACLELGPLMIQHHDLRTAHTTLRGLVLEVMNAGVSMEDPRIAYKEVQIDRDWFDRAKAEVSA